MTPEEKVLTLLGIMGESFDPIDDYNCSDFDFYNDNSEMDLSLQEIAHQDARESSRNVPSDSKYKFGWYRPEYALDDDDCAEWETISGEKVLVTDVTEDGVPPVTPEVYFKGLVVRCTRPARDYD